MHSIILFTFLASIIIPRGLSSALIRHIWYKAILVLWMDIIVLQVWNKGPYGLLRLHRHFRLTYISCCVARGCSSLAILHPYCLRMRDGYDGVQATTQQRYGCLVTLVLLVSLCYYTVLFYVGKGSMPLMYLSHSDWGLTPQSCLWLESTTSHHSYTLSPVECKTQGLVISRRLLFHFSPLLQPNKPFTLALVCINTFGPADHLRWVCIGYLHI
jgi:hypothetical protein